MLTIMLHVIRNAVSVDIVTGWVHYEAALRALWLLRERLGHYNEQPILSSSRSNQ